MQVATPRRPTHPGLIIPTTCFLVALAAASPAFAEPEVFEADGVRIVNLVGTLDVVVADSPRITLDVTGSDEMVDDVGVRIDDDTLIIARKGRVPTTDKPFDAAVYPTIRLTVPAATALTIVGMDGQATIGDIAAPLMVRVASVDLTVGNVATAVIDRSGSGNVRIGNVTGALTARLSGSGDFAVGNADQADIEKRGSGNIDIGQVEGLLRTLVHGSGNISVADAGLVDIEKHGSGDVSVGRIAEGLSYVSFGIGDVEIAAVDGPVVIETSSSGQVHIRDGRADPLRVVMHEYGNFTLEGEAVDPDLTAEGASVVTIASYIGELIARGTGTFDVQKRSAGNL